MLNTIKAIGFPVSLVVVIVLWTKIANNKDTIFDGIMFIIFTIVMIFMWIYNRNEYMTTADNKG